MSMAAIVGIAILTSAQGAGAKSVDLSGEKIVENFARCAVRGARDDARGLMNVVPFSATERHLMEKFLGKRMGCWTLKKRLFPTSMKVSGNVLRGAIAKQLYLDETAPMQAGEQLAKSELEGNDPRVEYRVVQCAVSVAPVPADRIVRAKRLSSEEALAANDLKPALNRCAKNTDKLELSGTAIHGLAAEALYKMRYSKTGMTQ